MRNGGMHCEAGQELRWAGSLRETASRLGHRQIQSHRMAGEALKAEMLIKAHRRIVLGVDNQGKYCRLCAHLAG